MKKKLVTACMISVFGLALFYAANRFINLQAAMQGNQMVKVLEALNQLWPDIAANPFFIATEHIQTAAIFTVVVMLVAMLTMSDKKKYRTGREYGSARWGTRQDIKPLMDPVFESNIIFTETERLMMSSRPKNPENSRNKNVLVIGGSGSGKTRFFVKPNLMQMHSSYVITDPKGTVLVECGRMLRMNGYKIKVLNVKDTVSVSKQSMHYNPFAYIRSELDILTLVDTIITNTKGEGAQAKEDFWVKAEKLYYMALIGYIYYEAPSEEKNFTTLLHMINDSQTREDDEEYTNPIDILFSELEQNGSDIIKNGELVHVDGADHFAVRQYQKYKLAAGKTAKSILISCGARLAPFDVQEVRELLEYDQLQLDLLGDRKTALFVIISDTNSTLNFIVSMMYTQMFNLLCDRADTKYSGRLPIHVRCLLDEFANIGQIPNFEKLIATIRSREISASIIVQTQSQLKSLYKDNMDTIVGNCDSRLFLGGSEPTTLKELSESLGKETIDSQSTSRTRGGQNSSGQNFQKMGRELMTRDELAVMRRNKCVLQISQTRPFLSEKYDIKKHKQYKYLSDFNKANAFDIEKFLQPKPRKIELTEETLVIESEEVA